MKKILSLASVATLVLSAGANTIDWSFSDVTVPSTPENANWQYVFLTYGTASDPTTWEMAGSNTEYDSEKNGETGKVDAMGTWTDSATSTQSYVIALWDGVTQSGNRFYAYQNSDNSYVTVTASDLMGTPGTSAGLPGTSGSVVEQIAAGTNGVHLSSTPVVPEPGTAALALAGLALLIRRRK
jgi:uncharacterized protein (TIGR03382 family)